MVHDVDLSEPEQEILESLWQNQMEGRSLPEGIEAEAERLGLRRKGWVTGEKLMLTAAGKDQASRAIRRHRLAERLMVDVLGAAKASAEEDACLLEHSLMADLAEKVCTFLGHPRVCPHGHPIPEGPCCRAAEESVRPVIAQLGHLRPGENGTIAYLATGQGNDLQKFLSMGIHPGDPVALVRKTPSVVFRCGHSQFAVDRVMASQIFVRRGA